MCVSGGKKCSFFEKFGVVCVHVTTVFEIHLLAFFPLDKAFESQVHYNTSV